MLADVLPSWWRRLLASTAVASRRAKVKATERSCCSARSLDAVAAAVEVNERMPRRVGRKGNSLLFAAPFMSVIVTVTADGVFGSEVHRCARLRALADGGEVFLSDAAVRTVGQHLPDDSSVSTRASSSSAGLPSPNTCGDSFIPHCARAMGRSAARPRPRRRFRCGEPRSLAARRKWRPSAARLDAGRLVTLVGPAGRRQDAARGCRGC